MCLMRRASLAVPSAVCGPALAGAGLVFSAMKPAESGHGIVLRCYNATARPSRGEWKVPWPVKSATQCRLDETAISKRKVGRGGLVTFEAGPREVVTILLR